MADIYSFSGNSIKDRNAVHFPVSSGENVYPSKPSNVIVKTDGSIEYGNIENTAELINKDFFTNAFKYKASDGTIVNGVNVAKSVNWIPTGSDTIKVDSTGYVTGIELLAWDGNGSYVGVWDAENETFITTDEKFYTEIKYKKVRSTYPNYKFKLSITRTNSIGTEEARKHILWVNTDYEITKETVNSDNGIILFDAGSVNVVQNALISGYQGIEGYDANFVATGFVDISKRISNTIEFNSTFIGSNVGCAFYDKGKFRIDGIWKNRSDWDSLGYILDNCPQHVKWTVPENAYYVRACMHKDYYESVSDFDFKFYVSNKSNVSERTYDTNFISIAHKGYGGAEIADTLSAFISAGEAGFSAIEIDCRRTTDGIYVISHNDTNTLYKNGNSQSKTISESAWEDLKGWTIDSAGKYPLCTLAQVFNTMKKYKVRYYIIDLKSGTNAEIMKLARRCGVVSQIMLSYYTQQSLLDDLSVIADYPQIAVRFTPSLTIEAYNTVKSTVKNQLFADINLSDGGTTYFPKALSMQIPILFSGVKESNKNAMAALGSGAMAQTTMQYSPYDFAKMIDLDFNQFPTLSTETESVSISTGVNGSVVVESDINDPACYVYGFSDDISVFDVSQNTYGAEVTFTISKVGVGTANLIVFTPTGEQLIIPVTAT